MTGRIFQYSDITTSRRVNAQVCIIGSGCGGSTLALKLVEAGIDVVMLEQGGYYPTETFDNNELNMAGKVSAQRSMETSNAGVPVLVYGNNVGGASVHYWADSYRTPDDRLELWREQYGLEGHDVADLAPIWPALDERLNTHPAPDEAMNRMNQLIRSAGEKLHWSGARVPQARRNCQRSGHCQHGCAFGAKQSQLVTSIPQAVEHGLRVYADARAAKMSFENGRAKSLEVRIVHRPSNRDSDVTLDVRADAFVVAAGGYGSSAFLLRQGLGKELPALGRHLALNPSPFVHALYPEEIVLWRNIPTSYGIDEFRLARYASGKYVEGGYLLMASQVHAGSLAALLPVWATQHTDIMTQLRRVGGTTGWIDDCASELGRIEVDGDGRRKVIYDQGPITDAMIRDLLKKQCQIHFAAGATLAILPDKEGTSVTSLKELGKIDRIDVRPGMLQWVAPHPAGGCRMGRDPKASVVAADHRVHGHKNLFVCDSSVFPTGPSVDPSYTIMAFSYIASRHILEQIGKA